MSTWGEGPFENDAAADWGGDLDDAEPSARQEMLRDALEAVFDDNGCLDLEVVQLAIAAAAVVAASLGGSIVDSSYAPSFLSRGSRRVEASAIRDLALRAVDRVSSGESEWRDLWEAAGTFPEAVAELMVIQGALVRA